MSRTKKILLGIAIVLVLLQLPGVYSWYSTYQLSKTISETKFENKAPKGFKVYVGVSHVHSMLGGHSAGSFDELISAANKNGLDYVMMNEHVSQSYDTAGKTLREKHGRTLFLGGNELTSGDGHRYLVTEGSAELGNRNAPSDKNLIEDAEENNRLLIHAYPKKYPIKEFVGDGLEVFSLHTNAKNMNPVSFLYDAIWCFRTYPSLTLARHFERPDHLLERYDKTTRTKRLLLFSGADAHSNIGLRLVDDANNKILSLKFDEYQSIFKLVRNHVLIPEDEEFNKQSLITAFKQGRSYVSVDVIGSGKGFDFKALVDERILSMGSEFDFAENTELVAKTPIKARIVLLKDGKKIKELNGANLLKYRPKSAGVFRIEVYQDRLGGPFDRMPWIMSNPIYIR